MGESIIVGRELGPVYWTGDKWAGTEPVTKMQNVLIDTITIATVLVCFKNTLHSFVNMQIIMKVFLAYRTPNSSHFILHLQIHTNKIGTVYFV